MNYKHIIFYILLMMMMKVIENNTNNLPLTSQRLKMSSKENSLLYQISNQRKQKQSEPLS